MNQSHIFNPIKIHLHISANNYLNYQNLNNQINFRFYINFCYIIFQIHEINCLSNHLNMQADHHKNIKNPFLPSDYPSNLLHNMNYL